MKFTLQNIGVNTEVQTPATTKKKKYFGCLIYFSICFMLADFSYFAIKYDVEFAYLLIILFLPQIYLLSILLYIFY